MVSPPVSFTETNTSTSMGNSLISKKGKPIAMSISTLSAIAFPNPYQGTFNLLIASPEAGILKIELFTVNGQKLQEKEVSVQKFENKIVPFTVTQHGTIFYRVQIAKYIVNGKVTGPN